MTTYILIDSNSGFIWGQADADSPEDACRIVDASIGTTDREYTSHGPRSSALRDGAEGYLVYAAPNGFIVDDGQDQGEIDAVSAMDLTAFVTYDAVED